MQQLIIAACNSADKTQLLAVERPGRRCMLQ